MSATGHGLDTDSAELILGRYGELWLKGKNRGNFERALVRNVRTALEPITPLRVERGHGYLCVVPERRAADAAARLAEVFGLSSLSPAWSAPAEPEAIARVAARVLEWALEAFPRERVVRFRVSSRRGDKRFPLISTELDRFVADSILEPYAERLRVDLEHPELSLGIHVRAEGAFVFAEKRRGAGGLPVGTLGRAMCLLSGGIDSPVAAWLAMKRGCDVSFVTFHSERYIGEAAVEKVRRLVRVLARYQRDARLFVAPFTAIQTAIRDGAPQGYRTILYRRMMQRIAVGLAARERALAVVTGDNLGQVASQTLENLRCIEDACGLPLLRPLLTYDKAETIELAQRIGTYDVSIEPQPDCCTVFQPTRPVIHGRLDACHAAERELDVDGLVREALEGSRREDLAVTPP